MLKEGFGVATLRLLFNDIAWLPIRAGKCPRFALNSVSGGLWRGKGDREMALDAEKVWAKRFRANEACD
jgi:hypothetical protein